MVLTIYLNVTNRAFVMEGVDPDTLLEWLQTGAGDERDIQVIRKFYVLLSIHTIRTSCFSKIEKTGEEVNFS